MVEKKRTMSKVKRDALLEYRNGLIRLAVDMEALTPSEAAFVFNIKPQLINAVIKHKTYVKKNRK